MILPVIRTDGRAELDFMAQLKQRSTSVGKQVTEAVTEILENVRQRGDTAVDEYTLKFDGRLPDARELGREELRGFLDRCNGAFLSAIRKAAENIADFHERQKQQSWLTAKDSGVILGQRIRGLKRVGIYVPGGTAAYPSSVLMNAIPAKIAGVEEIVMVTPPARNTRDTPAI